MFKACSVPSFSTLATSLYEEILRHGFNVESVSIFSQYEVIAIYRIPAEYWGSILEIAVYDQ